MANKTIVITGASAGIGAGHRAAARRRRTPARLAARRQPELDALPRTPSCAAPRAIAVVDRRHQPRRRRSAARRRDRRVRRIRRLDQQRRPRHHAIGARADRRRRRRDDGRQRQVGALRHADRRRALHRARARPDHQRVIVPRPRAAGARIARRTTRPKPRSTRSRRISAWSFARRIRTCTSRSSCPAWSRRSFARNAVGSPPDDAVYSGPHVQSVEHVADVVAR